MTSSSTSNTFTSTTSGQSRPVASSCPFTYYYYVHPDSGFLEPSPGVTLGTTGGDPSVRGTGPDRGEVPRFDFLCLLFRLHGYLRPLTIHLDFVGTSTVSDSRHQGRQETPRVVYIGVEYETRRGPITEEDGTLLR